MVESLAVTAIKVKEPTPPMSIAAVLTAGFDAVTSRLELILLPLALDVFLWLGPHLSVQALWQSALELFQAPPGADAAFAQNLDALQAALTRYAETFNLFSTLSAAPALNSAVLSILSMLQLDPEWLAREQNSLLGFSLLGLPSLMAGRAAVVHPGGGALTWQVTDPLAYFLLWGAFLLMSLWLGAWYLGGIAQQVREARPDFRQQLRQVWGDWARLTALNVLALLATAALGLPLAVVALVAGLLSPGLFWLVASLGWTVWMWSLFYTGFTIHGIILQRRHLFGAVWDSLRLVQANLPATLGLFLLLVTTSLGLGVVWNYPPDDSWFLLIGLAGHALISTALVAATFVFYQDRYRWMVEVQQAQRAKQAGPKTQ
jgi:hypothetical protein